MKTKKIVLVNTFLIKADIPISLQHITLLKKKIKKTLFNYK